MLIFLVFLCLFWGILTIFVSFFAQAKKTLHNLVSSLVSSEHIDERQYDMSRRAIDMTRYANVIMLCCYNVMRLYVYVDMIPECYNIMKYTQSATLAPTHNRIPIQGTSTNSRVLVLSPSTSSGISIA